MDSYSIQKRKEDKICNLGLNSPGAMKCQAVNTRRAELLREQKELAKVIRQRVGEDIATQFKNVKACQLAVKQSKTFGPVEVERLVPPSEATHEGIPHNLQNLLRISQEVDSLQTQAEQLGKAERTTQIKEHAAATCDSFSSWFSRYGEPKRQSHPVEKARSYVMKPRRVPFAGLSNAQTLRKGHLIS
eukprot:TRINITY_DN85359_c0_g1_i1.p1 TRINITY_DN85359_c0_g1~~TRINITY_DN85359_c0_g1_i1.p1  ORF type:complete len:188 (+),score=33.31 TRINITY_DN85359_c0_g1_i1:51-614(+)